MVKKLEFWGALGTAIYLCVITLAVVFKFQDFQSLKLNELGDFLAGVFGPVAFLWLVLGFLQQGRELKLSSEALQLQAVELKNAVDQQKEMVGIAGRQLEAELEKVFFEREQKRKASLPNIKLSAHVPSSSGTLNVDVDVVNYGSLAENVKGQMSNGAFFNVAVLGGDQKYVFNCKLPIKDASYGVSLQYDYGEGMKGEDNFVMKVAVSNIGSGIAQIYFVPATAA